ncbi:thioesterase family protein [uncultured Croceitalea sp.]|uniref:acyl-CoA thioesterase n=1 Tax=uncultured Croceitalea sp. TaxID=1798908 RepID=UPI003306248B
MFLKEFEIRWSDIDANRHLANSAYINYSAHARMSYLEQMGFNQRTMAQHQIGPVVFYEHIYYFKEVFIGKPIKVSTELKGMSEDGMFFEFQHDFYDADGKNFAHSEMMGAWIDLKARKLRSLPKAFLELVETIDKADDFKVLTKEDTRKFKRVPKNL